jgi:hypothetical protein
MIVFMIKKLLLFFTFIFCTYFAKAQNEAVLVFNGAYINIENAAQLVIDNPHDTAIKRTINGGHIISESENDIVRWNIGSTHGYYLVPFGVGNTDYLPLEFTTFGGIGNGYFELATYSGPTFLNSSYLPTGITNFTGFGASDNSPYVMDRFWKVKARNYNSGNDDRPDLNGLLLSYRDVEHSRAGNIINENTTWIQRYNPVLDSWYDYIPGGGSATVNTSNNTVSVNVVPKDETFDWWVIVDKISPLPVELLSFTATPVDNKIVLLDWVTSTEYSSEKFIIERSIDGKNWGVLIEKPAAGRSQQPIQYQVIDNSPYLGLNYYRLKQVDLDGSFVLSKVETAMITDHSEFTAMIYPNPTMNQINIQFSNMDFKQRKLKVLDIQGKLLIKRDLTSKDKSSIVPIDVSKLSQGSYLIQVETDSQESEVYKFVKL